MGLNNGSNSKERVPGISFFNKLKYNTLLGKDTLKGVNAIAQASGKIVRTELYGEEYFLVNDHEIASVILDTHADNFPRVKVFDPLEALFGTGLMRNTGETWKEMRKFYEPSMHSAMAEPFFSILKDEIDGFKREVNTTRNYFEKFNLEMEMLRLMFKAHARALLAPEVEINADSLIEAIHDIMDFCSVKNISKLRSKIKGKPVKTALDKLIPKYVQDAFTFINDMGEHIASDFLGIKSTRGSVMELLHRAYKAKAITYQQVVDEIKTVLVNSAAPAAEALTWAMMEIDHNSGVRRKIESEINSYRQTTLDPYELIQRHPYALNIIRESLRLYPPLWALHRRAEEETEVCGYSIPEDAWIMVLPQALHRNTKYWTNPLQFNPDRFAPDTRPVPEIPGYIPFSTGPHICVGKDLAAMEMVFILTEIKRDMKIFFYSKNKPVFSSGPIIHSQDIFFAKIESRNSRTEEE